MCAAAFTTCVSLFLIVCVCVEPLTWHRHNKTKKITIARSVKLLLPFHYSRAKRKIESLISRVRARAPCRPPLFCFCCLIPPSVPLQPLLKSCMFCACLNVGLLGRCAPPCAYQRHPPVVGAQWASHAVCTTETSIESVVMATATFPPRGHGNNTGMRTLELLRLREPNKRRGNARAVCYLRRPVPTVQL